MNTKPTFNPTTTRIDALNSILAHSKPYAAFVACAAAMGQSWATDDDVAAFEASLNKWSAGAKLLVPMEKWSHLWIASARIVLEGGIAWTEGKPESTDLLDAHIAAQIEPGSYWLCLDDGPEIDSAPAVDIPTDAGGYFPDEEGEDI